MTHQILQLPRGTVMVRFLQADDSAITVQALPEDGTWQLLSIEGPTTFTHDACVTWLHGHGLGEIMHTEAHGTFAFRLLNLTQVRTPLNQDVPWAQQAKLLVGLNDGNGGVKIVGLSAHLMQLSGLDRGEPHVLAWIRCGPDPLVPRLRQWLLMQGFAVYDIALSQIVTSPAIVYVTVRPPQPE